MAARKTLFHDETARKAIQTSQLINRLNNHANGTVELSPTQVRAIEILLRKSLPDLVAVDHSGEIGHAYVAAVPTQATNVDEWQTQHGSVMTVQ